MAIENQILNSKQLYEFAIKEIEGMSFGYVTNKDHQEEAKYWKQDFCCQNDTDIALLQAHFVFIKEYSSSSEETKKRVTKRT